MLTIQSFKITGRYVRYNTHAEGFIQLKRHEGIKVGTRGQIPVDYSVHEHIAFGLLDAPDISLQVLKDRKIKMLPNQIETSTFIVTIKMTRLHVRRWTS